MANIMLASVDEDAGCSGADLGMARRTCVLQPVTGQRRDMYGPFERMLASWHIAMQCQHIHMQLLAMC